MKKIFPALLLTLCLLLSACAVLPPSRESAPDSTKYPYQPLQAIDYCVLEPDDRARLTDRDKEAYRSLMTAMLERADSVTLSPDTVDPQDLLDLLRESPYYYFLDDAKLDGDTVRFSYAYSADEQKEMRDFMDGRLMEIANYKAAEEDNTLDTILKIYLAVTHEMTYDHDRTDNKMLGSPLFVYPADEIYKALRDKKSLCYGFAYVMRFALLQRGIDCFCVHGLCTAHGDGHEWIIFRYGDRWYHCDPAWDRADQTYAKLIHFGKTDREREVDTLVMTDFSTYHDPDFGKVECTDDLFSIFRGINHFSYGDGHRFFMTDIHNKEYIFDTDTFSFVE